MSSFDAYTPPVEPVATPVARPRLLFDATNGVVGLRAAATRLSGSVRTVSVWLYGDPPAAASSPAAWSFLSPGQAPPVTVATVTAVAATTRPDGTPVPSHVDLELGAGPLPGRAPYRLRLDPGVASVDPTRGHLPVRLRPECGDALDDVAVEAPARALLAPDYDTLARDYPALRATLLERLLAADPGADTSPADATVAMLELFAHLGDLLHYRLDRVATEAWLPTARRRACVTRHARVVDFPVPPATSAAVWVQVLVAPAAPGGDPDVLVQPGDTATDDGDVVPEGVHATVDLSSPARVRATYAEVALHDWGERDARLDPGATSAVLVRPPASDGAPLADWLAPGAALAFEVVAVDDADAQRQWARRARPWPPTGGAPARAALASRPAQVVHVTEVVAFEDPLLPGVPLLRVRWSAAEALTSPVPCSVDTTAGQPVVGVARLGLFHAHDGLVVDGGGEDTLLAVDRLTGGRPDPAREAVAAYWLPAAGPGSAPGLSCAPGGRPWQLDVSVTLPGGAVVPAVRVPSLVRAPTGGLSFVVDHDDDEPPLLRFTTGALGRPPPSGSTVRARYQVGAGPAGNIARDTVTRLVRCTTAPGVPARWAPVEGATARNLTPGTGGAPALPLEQVGRDAPQAYAAVPRRAVLVTDLPPFAAAVPGVVRATARRDWSGSWPVGLVSVETGRGGAGGSDLVGVERALDAVRMAGTESVAVAATPVGLLFALTVCLVPGTSTEGARGAILAVLRPGTADAPGLFWPGRHVIGGAVWTSTVSAAVAALPYVDAVGVTEARRLSEPPGTRHPVLSVGPGEVPVCDDDPAEPDRGRIELTVEGGR